MVELGLTQESEAGAGGTRTTGILDAMRSNMHDTMDLQSYGLQIQQQMNMFNTVLHAKSQLMKDIADVARDSIQKSGQN